MTRLRPGRDHAYTRPSWLCSTCGAPWPCQPAKLRLLGEYRSNRLGLMIYLGATMASAVTEIPADVNLVGRFLLWARPRPGSAD